MTDVRSRRKPVRRLVPFGDRLEDGLSVRAAIPADLLDLLDVLFRVSCRPVADGRAINRGLLSYVLRLSSLGPMHAGLEDEVAERQAHHVWRQLEPIVRLERMADVPGSDAPSAPQALYDVVMQGLLVGTLVGAGGPHAIRRYFRRYNLAVPAGRPALGEEDVQRVRNRFSEESRVKGYGSSQVDQAAAHLVLRYVDRASESASVVALGGGEPAASRPGRSGGARR